MKKGSTNRRDHCLWRNRDHNSGRCQRSRIGPGIGWGAGACGWRLRSIWPRFQIFCVKCRGSLSHNWPLKAKAPVGSHWLHEIKFDGYRVQVHVNVGKRKVFTRNGLDWTKWFSTIAVAFDIYDKPSSMVK